MAWDKGFNFRSTSGYVTDGTDETYVLAEAYPVTRNGVTFGWATGSMTGLNRNSANDRRLAGINYLFDAAATFQVDLPASGQYDIRLAVGDAGSGYGELKVLIKDGGSTLITVFSNTTSNNFLDATAVLLSAANWPGSNVASRVTFSGSTLTLEVSDINNYNLLAHLFVSQVQVFVPYTRVPSMGPVLAQ